MHQYLITSHLNLRMNILAVSFDASLLGSAAVSSVLQNFAKYFTYELAVS